MLDPPFPWLHRHQTGDWGAVGPEDWAANDRALMDGDRLLSSYLTDGGTTVARRQIDVSCGASVVLFTPAFLSRVLLPRGIFHDTFAGTFASSSPGSFENPLEVASLLLLAS